MYLSKITLENFQAFEKGEFILSPNLNVLVGVSNVGKSSVARALSLVLFNSWDKSWTRSGAKYCTVTIETNTGIVVTREKGEKVNRCILTLPNQQPIVFESFGSGVPEEVQQALQIKEIQIGEKEFLNLNLASQHDNLFLLSSVPSFRAKVLGKLTGANILDYAIREINKDRKHLVAEKNSKEIELETLREQIIKLVPIESYETQIKDLEQKRTAIGVQEARCERIRALFKRVKACKEAWVRESQIEALLGQFSSSSLIDLAQKADRIKALRSLLNKIVNNDLTLKKFYRQKETLKQVDLATIPLIENQIIRLRGLKDLSIKLEKNQNSLIDKQKELSLTQTQHEEIHKQYTNKLKEAGTCPICNQGTTEL
jgi:predicted ATP-dependent endonuclease of OLD family